MRRRSLWSLIGLLVLVAMACSQVPLPVTSPPATPQTQAPVNLPPVVVDFSPPRGAEVAPQEAALRLHFDRAMDKASVESALQIRPPVQGEISWPDERTMVFRPQGLALATRYHVSLGDGVRAADGMTLTQGVDFTFQTVAPLEVTHFSPAEEDGEVRGDAPILLTFNYPVVPINCTGQEAGRAEGCTLLDLSTDPPMQMRGFWIDTATYRAEPMPGWQAGTVYEVSLAPVTALNGAQMTEPLLWHFQTVTPKLVEVEPPFGAEDVPLETGISLHFNTPMDPAATGSAFSLADEAGHPVAGTIVWADEGAQMIFTPTEPLALDTVYIVRLSSKARSLTGAPLETAYSSRFHTVPPARLVGLTPPDGASGVELYESVVLRLEGNIDPETVMPHVSITPAPPEAELYTYWHDKSFHISWQMEPRTRYCVQVEPGIADRYGNQTQETMQSCFTTGDEPPLFILLGEAQGNFVTLDAAEAPVVYAVQRNVSEVGMVLAAADGPVGTVARLRAWSERFDAPPNRVVAAPIHLSRTDHPLPTGYYRLFWEEPSLKRRGPEKELLLAVIDRHVAVRLSTEAAIVWVTDLHTGAPVGGAEVRLLRDDGHLLAGGTTDEDGIARITLTGIERLWEIAFVETGQAGQPGFGVAINGVHTSNTSWSSDFPYAYWKPAPYLAYLYTDRPIYRPGQTVHWRLIVRDERNDRYTLPPLDLALRLSLHDCQSDAPLDEMTVSLSDLGTAEGSFLLPGEALPCPYYALKVDLPSEKEGTRMLKSVGGTFAVAAYRKPAFEVAVTPQRDDLLQGEQLRADVAATYYFGGAVSDAPLRWRLIREARTVPSPLGWAWNDAASALMPWDEETVAEGNGRTDVNGHFLIQAQVALPQAALPVARSFRLEVEIEDEGGFPVSGESEVRVHPARFELGVRPERLVAVAGKKVPVAVQAVDWYGAPIAQQPLTVTLARRTWYLGKVAGEYAPTWHYTDTVLATFDVRTDAEGKAQVLVTPPAAGPYVVAVQGRDDGGNRAYAEASLWVSGPEGVAWQQEDGRVKPVADALRYEPGETAHILLPTPFDGPFQVLMTVERSGILDAQHFVTDTPNPIIDLPIVAAYAPNVFVSFIGVQTSTAGAPQVVLGTTELKVEPTAQRLRVAIQTDRAEYRPGETAHVVVGVYDAQGNPVDAEVGLAAVDKAVLALAEEQSPSIEEAFYGERPLRVVAGDSLSTLSSRWNGRLDELQKEADYYAMQAFGGMGGGGGGGEVAEVRRNFPDTAFWAASLRTGPQGEIGVDVPLPDSLTTWVLDGRAVTADTKVGQAEVEIVATKPFFVRPLTPRFFVAGDEAEIGAIVYNNTDHQLSVEVQLAADGAQLHSEAVQSLMVAAGGRKRLSWRIAVPDGGSDAVLLTFSAQGGGYSDTVRPTIGTTDEEGALPVLRYRSPDVTGTGGAMADEGSRLEAVVVPQEAGETTRLDLLIAPSLVAAASDLWQTREAMPASDNVEAIVDRCLPDAYLYLALTQAQVADPQLEAELPARVEEALNRLERRQHEDGGWGWSEDESDLQLSAYATLGMLTAKAAGLDVNATTLEAALRYLRNRLMGDVAQAKSRPPTMEDALAFYVLTLGGEPWPSGMASALYDAREAMGVTGRAYLTLALGSADPADRRVAVLLDRLRSDAITSANGVHWEEDDPTLWLTDIRATAVAVKALAHFAPDDAFLPDAVRWLTVARAARYWLSPQEKVWMTMALLDVAVTTHELEGAYSWGISLNGHAIAGGNVSPETVREPERFQIGLSENPIEGLVRGRPNALEIARGHGPGVLYYTADFVLDEPAAQVEPESRGLAVERYYCDPFLSDEAHCVPPEEVHTGDLVEVRLKVVAPAQRYFVELTDFYPAGMEPVDPSLRTETAELSGEEGGLPFVGWYWGEFGEPHLLDDRAIFFARQLTPGRHEVRYLLRATFGGRYRVMPALVGERYFPEVWGRSAGTTLTIVP